MYPGPRPQNSVTIFPVSVSATIQNLSVLVIPLSGSRERTERLLDKDSTAELHDRLFGKVKRRVLYLKINLQETDHLERE